MDNTRNEKYAAELAELIRAETVSEAGRKNTEKYEAFHEKLFNMFPRLFAEAETEDFDGSLLIRWKGKSGKEPILLMSHHDVVEAPGEWTHPPFSEGNYACKQIFQNHTARLLTCGQESFS